MNNNILVIIGIIIAMIIGIYFLFFNSPSNNSSNNSSSSSSSSQRTVEHVACDLLDASTVSSITGDTFTALPAQPGGLGISVCSYTSTSNTMVVLTVRDQTSDDRAEEIFGLDNIASQNEAMGSYSLVGGVGEGAFFKGDPANILEFYKNNAVVSVAAKGNIGDNKDIATQIGQAVALGL